jgi:predicted permease
MRHLHTYMRHALRGFARTPAFAITAVATLAVALGGLTTVFSLINALLLRPLPVERPAELVGVEKVTGGGANVRMFSYPQFLLLRDEAQAVAGVMAHGLSEYAVGIDGAEPTTLLAGEVTSEYFEVLGVRAARGRLHFPGVAAGEEVSPAVVVSHELWQTRLGGREDVIGATLRVNGQPLPIMGVAAAGFRGTTPAVPLHFWVPVGLVPLLRPGTDILHPERMKWLEVVARLAPGTTRSQAEVLLGSGVARAAVAGHDAAFDGTRRGREPITGVRLQPLRAIPGFALGPVLGFFALLLATGFTVLLIASVNITNMMLARGTARAREMAVRRSLGATRGQLVLQLITENVLLFVVGAAIGLLAATWLLTLVPHVLTQLPVEVRIDAAPDLRVVAFAFGVATLAGILFGLAPALHATDAGTMGVLREGMSARRGTRLRSTFVAAQIALSLVLLISGGLLARALQQGMAVDPGFDASGVAAVRLDLAPFGYDAARSELARARLLEQLAARADIESAATATEQPLMSFSWRFFRPEGQDATPTGGFPYNSVSSDFFTTLGIRLVAGRTFTAADRAGAPRVAVVNAELARRYWPGENPIGKRLFDGPQGEEQPIEVIGVVATGRYQTLHEEPQPFVYLSLPQERATGFVLYARARGSSSAAARNVLRDAVRSMDGNVPVQPTSLDATLHLMLMPQRIAAAATGSFGVIGLLLAAIGLYGLVAFSVAQRRREIGLRVALGARDRDVRLLFLRQAARLLVAGTVAGIIVAAAASRLLASQLYGVDPLDPLTFTAVPLLLGLTALLASWLPARRASRVTPLTALRAE